MAEAISDPDKGRNPIADSLPSSDAGSFEERLRECQKMALMGQLATGVAHDFNNILSATLIHLGLLLQNPRLDAPQRESLKIMENELSRAASLTRQLSAFGRRSPAAGVEALDLNHLIGENVKMLRRLLRENIIVVFMPAAEPIWVKGDVGLLEQLVVNLCLVSREAMPQGGTLTLSTELKSSQDSETTNPGKDGDMICISATSSESSMSEKPRKQSKVPGQTSKESQWSLETIRQIVARHHGRVEAPSQNNDRVSFRIYLPGIAKPHDSFSASGEDDGDLGGSETILLVEDELFLRRVSTLCLRKLGYAVFDAGDGLEALKLWEKHRDKIDLLFTDFLLPSTDTGLDLAQRMGSEKPSLRVLISSGHGDEWTRGAAHGEHEIARVTKPYAASGLAKAVRECLDAPSLSERQLSST